MRITVLGSGSAYSDLNRFNSCYLVESGGEKILIDCGSDALRAIQKAEIGLYSITKIFITHMHADHCGGLPAVLTAMHVSGRKEPVEVRVPHTQLEFVKLWMDNLFIYNGRMSFEFSLLPLAEGEVVISDGLRMEFIPTKHLSKYSGFAAAAGIRPLSFSVIVREGDKTFFFSSDLDSLDEVRGYVRNSISFIEATHPSLGEIAALASGSNGSRYFTHVPMELERKGEWTRRLAAEFRVKKLNLVRDGQIINL